eukprot:scaffold6013_cov118-Skeletonema_dohrnii-CCMP3373.AAC.4
MGSFKGSESDEEAWELWYNGTVTGAGLDSESCIGKCGAGGRTDDDEDGDMRQLLLDLPANETRALYVSFQEAVLVYSSKNDENNNSSLDFENDDIELFADGGVKRKGWDGKVVHPRLFNGALTYETKRNGEII